MPCWHRPPLSTTKYTVPLSPAALSPLPAPVLEHYFVGGDVGAVSRPRATEDLPIYTVVPEHTTALTVLRTACIVQWFSQYVLAWATLIIIIIMIIIIQIQIQTLQTNIYKAPSVNTKS